MGALRLSGGLYLKDYPWHDVRGTWTGFVEINGRDRIVVALQVERDEDGIVSAKHREAAVFLRKLQEMIDFADYDLDHDAHGSLYVLFVPPQ